MLGIYIISSSWEGLGLDGLYRAYRMGSGSLGFRVLWFLGS